MIVNNKVSSAKEITSGNNSSARSFLNIKNNNGPITEPRETSALILVHVEISPFKTTPCFLSLKKSLNK